MAQRQDPQARAMARAKAADVPMDMQGMDPEMKSTLGGEQTRVFKNRLLYGGTKNGNPGLSGAIQTGWSNMVKAFNGNSQTPKAAPAPVPTLSADAKKYFPGK